MRAAFGAFGSIYWKKSISIKKHIPVFALLVYTAGLIYGGWMPMHFTLGGFGGELVTGMATWRVGPAELAHSGDVQLNILIFIPIGIATCRIWGVNLFSFLATLSISATASTAIELGQLLEPSRFMTLRDIITNISGGLVGFAIGSLFYAKRLKRLWAIALRKLSRKYGLMGALAISAALVLKTGWMAKPTPEIISQNWGALTLSPLAGLERFGPVKWLTTAMLPYTAITLLLASRRADKILSDSRIFAAGLCAFSVAVLCEIIRFVTPTEPPATLALVLAAASICVGALLAPVLHKKRLELPAMVLFGEICVTALLIRVAWSADGGGSRLPLWGLYQHDFDWGYFAMARRMAFMAAVGFMAAFYMSLKFNWTLKRRVFVATLSACSCAVIIEIVKIITGNGANIAGMLEHIFAACCGTVIFALAWHLLDRRSSSGSASKAYIGPERRR